MNRTAPLLLLALALPGCDDPVDPPDAYRAQAATPVTPTPAPAPTRPRPTFLYEVQSAGDSSYIFASLEGGSTLRDSFPSEYDPTFRYARVLVVQWAASDAERTAFVIEHLRGAGPLNSALDRETFVGLTDQISDQMPADAVSHLTPEIAFTLLGLELFADAYGGNPERATLSPAHDLYARRETVGTAIVGLDQPADVTRELESLRAAGALEAISEVVAHAPEHRAELRRVIDAYEDGDEAAVIAALAARSPGTARFEAAMHAVAQEAIERWMPAIQREISAQNAFIVLPASHVLGEGGVIARLRAAGLTVERVIVQTPSE